VNASTGSTLSTSHLTPTIDVNATGNISIVWSDDRGGQFDIYYQKSTDNGRTFLATDKQINTVSTSDSTNPIVAIGDTNNIFITWQDFRNSDWDIFISNSTNNGVTFTTEARVDDDTTNSDQLFPSIAAGLVNLTDSVILVWSDLRDIGYKHINLHSNNYDIYLSSSVDEGNSFSPSYCVHNSQRKPAIAVGDDGTVYTAWTDYRLGAWGDIFFTRSMAGGQIYETNFPISNDSVNRGRGDLDMVIEDDVIYLVWEDSTNDPNNNEIIFTKSTDGGLSFSEPKNITNGSALLELNPAIAVDKTGKIHVVYEDNSIPLRWNIFYINSVDNGTTWSSPTMVYLMNSFGLEYHNPCIAVDDTQNPPYVYIAYENMTATDPGNISFSRSTDGGATFGVEFNVSQDLINTMQGNPAIDVGPNGYVSLVWEDFRNTVDWDLYYAKSITSGFTFQSSVLVNVSNTDERFPDIVVDPSDGNNITIIWQDNRNTAPNSNYDIYMTTSNDTGISFPAAVRVDDTGSIVRDQQYPKVATDPGGTIYTIWEDMRDDNGDIYFNMTIDGTFPKAEAGNNIMVSQAEWGHFLAAGSWDNVGIENYTWTFNDGGLKTIYGYNSKYLFNNPAIITVTLTVRDYWGNTATDTLTVTVIDMTPPAFGTDASDNFAYTGDNFNFNVPVTDYSSLTVNVIYKYGASGSSIYTNDYYPIK
jgi:hypothetical protein